MEDLLLPDDDDPFEPHPVRSALIAATATAAAIAALYAAPALTVAFAAGVSTGWFFSDRS